MITGRRIVFLLTVAMLFSLAGCGGGSTLHVQNQPPPPSSTVSIQFQPAPPTAIQLNTSVPITAVVNNDATNAGVDWIVPCTSAAPACGTLSAAHTNSGQPVNYTPPSSLSGNTQSFSVVAYASADRTQNAVAPFVVTAFAGSLQGTYVMQLHGVDPSTFPYQFAGVATFDGSGGISGGQQTVNFAGSTLSETDVITGGSYFIGADGRGTITLKTSSALGTNGDGVETFSLVFLSASRALIAQLDSTASGAGTMDLQTSVAAPSGGYAFVVSGTDLSTFQPISWGGVFNIDSPNTISGKGSIADQNLAGFFTARQALSGSFTGPDSLGTVSLSLSVPTFTNATDYQFTGYIIDSTHIALIETDVSSGYTGGIAIGQGTATGTFTTASFAGTFAFGFSGVDLTVFTEASMTSVGAFTADGNGSFTNGYTDTFWQGNLAQSAFNNSGLPSQVRAQFQGTYSVDQSGTGRGHVNFHSFAPAPQPSYAPLFIFYLTGNGNPPLILGASDTSAAFNYPFTGTGIAYPQTPPSSLSGTYGFNITQQNGTQVNGTGQFTADSASGTLSGADDLNLGSPVFSTLSGTFTVPNANAISSGSLTLLSGTSPFAVDYLGIDAKQGFVIETDIANPLTSTFTVSLGYYASRTPVCAGCP